MKDFARLFQRLDQTNSTNAKVDALTEYFEGASNRDTLWTIALLSHKRPKRAVNSTQMKTWAAELAGIPFWLIDESHHIVGDMAETVACILPPPESPVEKSLSEWVADIQGLSALEEDNKREGLVRMWKQLESEERFVFNKIITGGFRMGVSQKLMTRALSKHTGIEVHELAHRLMGKWDPGSTSLEELIFAETQSNSHPYPFYLSYALEEDPASLGDISEWSAEYKWDGIRGQVIVRGNELFVWSRGEELVTEKYPEYSCLIDDLPDGTVLDGEILPFKEGKILPFQSLQTRIGRKTISAALLRKTPVVFRAYDVLEYCGDDVRTSSFRERRKMLDKLVPENHSVLQKSEILTYNAWEDLSKLRDKSRQRQSEGLMLKKWNAIYGVGRKRGDWWKWKVDPFTIDAVLIYAMRGHGRRATLYTDYTFAVWDGDSLVPFTKAYSGLTDKEIAQVDRYVKQNTIDRFGPVRSVTPSLVFELAFEGIQASSRHKSGIALRFPRIKRWRTDKPAAEANTLADLKALLDQYQLPE